MNGAVKSLSHSAAAYNWRRKSNILSEVIYLYLYFNYKLPNHIVNVLTI